MYFTGKNSNRSFIYKLLNSTRTFVYASAWKPQISCSYLRQQQLSAAALYRNAARKVTLSQVTLMLIETMNIVAVFS